MPTNPNIILSGNQMAAPRLPDVNAMMQTRTAGLENIYNIEQQRAEQAKAAQKEQEAALVEALAPAYATAFKGGGSREAITAAYGLLPPEIQPSVKGQIDKLLAMPSDDLRLSALEASMAGSEAGRTLLNRIPTEIQRMNAEIQRGQLRVAEKKLAMEEGQAGVPKPMTEYEKAQSGLREREIKLAEERAAREAAAVETPKIKSDKARSKVDDTLSEMMLSYNKLKQEGAIVSTEASGLENVIARTGAALGTTAGRAVGTKAQTERDYIQSLRMDLIRDIKAATGMSAQELNSNFELQVALDALSDPYSQSFETALRTIAKISQSYGKGDIAATIDAAARGKSDLQPAPAGTATGRIPRITSDEQYDMLPSGAVYIDPDGTQRTKR